MSDLLEKLARRLAEDAAFHEVTPMCPSIHSQVVERNMGYFMRRLREVHLDELLRSVERLETEVIIGYENEQQETWPENCKDHRCKVCYDSAQRVRAAKKAFEESLSELGRENPTGTSGG